MATINNNSKINSRPSVYDDFFPGYPSYPGDRRITQAFSDRHEAWDIRVRQNTNLHAPFDGEFVRFVVSSNGTSVLFIKDPVRKLVFRLAHVSAHPTHMWHLNEGFPISFNKGDVIAVTGGSPGTFGAGRSTGPHLHMRIEDMQGAAINPSLFYHDLEGKQQLKY